MQKENLRKEIDELKKEVKGLDNRIEGIGTALTILVFFFFALSVIVAGTMVLSNDPSYVKGNINVWASAIILMFSLVFDYGVLEIAKKIKWNKSKTILFTTLIFVDSSLIVLGIIEVSWVASEEVGIIITISTLMILALYLDLVSETSVKKDKKEVVECSKK